MLKSAFVLGVVLSGALVAQAQNVAPAASTEPIFADVPRDHWAYAAVQKLAAAGILEGYPPGTTPAPVAAPAPVAVPAPVASGSMLDHKRFLKWKSALASAPALKGSLINLDVEHETRTITLSGLVSSRAQRVLAEAITKKNAVGYRVVNQLQLRGENATTPK